jgi:hypothetical protein
MASGIKVDKKAFNKYDIDFRQKRKYKFLIFGVEKDKSVVIRNEEAGDKKLNPTYADFIKALCKPKKPQWGIIDYEAKSTTDQNRILNKIVMISWNPTDAKVKDKMIFGSTTGTVKTKLDPHKKIQATTPADVEEDVVRKAIGL